MVLKWWKSNLFLTGSQNEPPIQNQHWNHFGGKRVKFTLLDYMHDIEMHKCINVKQFDSLANILYSHVLENVLKVTPTLLDND